MLIQRPALMRSLNSLPRLLRAANESPHLAIGLILLLLTLPAVLTGCAALLGRLGPNPSEVLVHEPGIWSLILLLQALAFAPLRDALIGLARWRCWHYGKRMSDWNWLMRLRRSVGLAAFFYAVVHLCLYIVLGMNFRWSAFSVDLRDKPYIVAGVIAFLLLLPLAITSTDGWMRRLKRNWKRLHLLVYPAAILAQLHFMLLSKPGPLMPLVCGGVLLGLLVYRIVHRWVMGSSVLALVDGTVPERPTLSGTEKYH